MNCVNDSFIMIRKWRLVRDGFITKTRLKMCMKYNKNTKCSKLLKTHTFKKRDMFLVKLTGMVMKMTKIVF